MKIVICYLIVLISLLGRVNSVVKRQAVDNALWPSALIVTLYDDDLVDESKDPDLERLLTIIEAQMDISEKTCIEFVPDEEYETQDYERLVFIKGNYGRCLTSIGHQAGSIQQPAYISDYWSTKEDVMHEILHALGLAHTQNRPDARNYTTVNLTNVRVFDRAQFTPWTNVSTFDVPYEYGSLMHYDGYQFAMQSKFPALIATDPLHQQTMGSGTGLSVYDVKLLNLLYGCADKPKEHTKVCNNGGFQNPAYASKCVCPLTYDTVGSCDQKAEDVTELEAGPEFQTLTRTYDGDGTRKDEWTFEYFWITAHSTSLIEVVITELPTTCQPGCRDGGVELKADEDKVATGYRFCCSTSVAKTITAPGPVLPVIFFNRVGPHNYSIQYRKKADPTKCDTKYDLFTERPAASAIVVDLLDACDTNRYVQSALDKSQCYAISDRVLTVLENRTLSADGRLRAIKNVFDMFTDSGNNERRTNFTKTAYITEWGSFEQLLKCPVTIVTSSTVTPVPATTAGPTEITMCTTFYSTLGTFHSQLQQACASYWASRSADELQSCNETVAEVSDVIHVNSYPTFRARMQNLKNCFNSYTDNELLSQRATFLNQAQIGTWGTVSNFIRCPIDSITAAPTTTTEDGGGAGETTTLSPARAGDCSANAMTTLLNPDSENTSCVSKAIQSVCEQKSCTLAQSSALSLVVTRFRNAAHDTSVNIKQRLEDGKTVLKNYIGTTTDRKTLMYPTKIYNFANSTTLWGTIETFLGCWID